MLLSSVPPFNSITLSPIKTTVTVTIPSACHHRFTFIRRHHSSPNFKFVQNSMREAESVTLLEAEEAELLLATCITRTLPPALTLESGLGIIKNVVEELKTKPSCAKSGMYRFQTYSFSNSISIIETLSVHSSTTVHEKSTDVGTGVRFEGDPLSSRRELSDAVIKNSLSEAKHNSTTDGSKVSKKNVTSSLGEPVKELGKPSTDSDSDPEIASNNTLHAPAVMLIDDGDPALPSEWVPPNLSIPILDLVDVVFQLQDGGWIRRNAFWVAKQVLQLGMSDAFDDWLIAKIQLLRRGSIVASGIKRLEQILWPDGIFITKHPKRQQPTPSPRPPQGSPGDFVFSLFVINEN